MKTGLTGLAPAALAAVLALLPAIPAYAHSEPLLGLTDHNELITFESYKPGQVSDLKTVTGLAAGETLLAIDRMPDTNRLFGLTANRIYELNEITAAATPVTPAGLFVLSGTAFDMDFIPREFRIRVVSNTGQNFRAKPFTGEMLIDDALSYPAGDAHGGAAPSIVAIGHTENYGGAVSPKVYGLDSQLNALMLGTVANEGRFETVKNFSFDIADQAGLDVSGGTGNAFITTSDGTTTKVYQVFLRTGRTVYFGEIGGGYNVVDFAAAAVPEPATWAMMIGGFVIAGATARRRRAVRVA